MTYKVKWNGTPRLDLEEQLRTEIDEFCGGQPELLIFHTMEVGGADDSLDGPFVSAQWDEDAGCIVAEYFAETEWVTIEGVELVIGSDGEVQ